jgi:hypothetical protein
MENIQYKRKEKLKNKYMKNIKNYEYPYKNKFIYYLYIILKNLISLEFFILIYYIIINYQNIL